jgi:hypothetical protein
MGKLFNWMTIKGISSAYDKSLKCKQEKNYLGAIGFAILYLIGTFALILTGLLAIVVFSYEIFTTCSSKEIKIPKEIIKLQKEYEETKRVYETNPKLLEVKIDSIWKKTISIPIKDKSGKRAILGIYTITNGYYWGKGKNEICDFTGNGTKLNINSSFIDYLKTEYFQKGVARQNELICVGNSSFEENGNVYNEECRSYCRAMYLRRLLEKNIPFVKIDILPIGKSDSTGLCSDIQRSIVIIGVLKVDSLIDLKDALYLHLLKDKNIPFRFWDYSLCKDYNSFFNSSQIPCKNSNPVDMCK